MMRLRCFEDSAPSSSRSLILCGVPTPTEYRFFWQSSMASLILMCLANSFATLPVLLWNARRGLDVVSADIGHFFQSSLLPREICGSNTRSGNNDGMRASFLL